MDKRRAKVEDFDYGDHWAVAEGSGETAILTWGSTTGAAREALRRLAARGRRIRLIAPRLLAPARPDAMASMLDGVDRLLVVEQSHSGQFHRYLRGAYDLPPDVKVLHRPGPLPIAPAEIVAEFEGWT